MEWFYENNGQQSGPVSREEILRLIMQQRIRPETLVWTPRLGTVGDRHLRPGWFPL